MTEDGNRRAVRTDKAPAPAFSYSQGIVSGGLLFVSGQVPIDPVTKAVPEGFGDQVRQTLDNVAAIAEAAGGRLADAVRVGVYLANLDDFDEMDAAYREYFEGAIAGAHHRGCCDPRFCRRGRRCHRAPG